ncbi:PAS domain S-box protein [Candidatus Magnetominusculus dajiuhuensis]|uniref:PAS domain S-box protein n=1 Tax=Candidatus Magnetominusculus dajiuhuensis TaxID=3137712 RepID=UPI003B43B520
MNALSKLKISKKLYVIILIAIVSLAGIAGSNLHQLEKVYDLANYATINTVPSFNTIYDTEILFLEIRILMRNHILNTEDLKMTSIDREIQEKREEIKKKQSYYEEKLISDPEDLRLHKAAQAAFRDYYNNVLDPVLALSRQNKNNEARELSEKTQDYIPKVEHAISDHIEYNQKLAVAGSKDAANAKKMAAWINILATALAVVLLLIASWVVGNLGLANPITVVVENLKQLAEGQTNVVVSGVARHDEVGEIARAAQVFNEFVQKLNTQAWIKTHTSEIATELQKAEDFRTLTQTAVSKVAPVIGAGHGAFYVLDNNDGRYNLLASYGYRERKHLNSSFAVGEGLVGQCVMEKNQIMLSAPQNYIQINSGLGEGPPACIIVLPVIHGERVLGVMEMASFQVFGEREKAVLEALLPVLSSSMEILDRNLRTRELLVASQEQAERMEKQAAQLEEQTVEMEAQQAELMETENWFRSIIETAPDGMMVVDAAGQILLTNPNADKLFGYPHGELVGGQIDHLVPEAMRGTHSKMRAAFMAEEQSRAMGEAPRQIHALRKDGSEVVVAVSLSPLPARGGRGRCVSVAVRAA